MHTLLSKHWHHMSVEEIIDILNTDREKGLALFEVDKRQKHFGPNSITGKKAKGPLLRFLLQFHQPLIYILLAAGAVTGLLQEWIDAGVILGVVLLNAVIGFVQEAKAVKAIEALARTMMAEATVVRSGIKRRISSAEVVPGDIVLLQSGDKVPADLRLFQVRDLHADESALTGESVPVRKSPDVLEHDTGLADRRNMAYASSLVTYGQGSGIVVAIGDTTEVGRISQLISSTESLETPLTRKIAGFSHILLYTIIALAVVTFVVGFLRGQPAFDVFMAAVALSVGAIPEGLPAALTITLAIGVARMARRKAVIRKLTAVETLGSTTVICSDKTGTLTENQMTVQEIFDGSHRFEVTGAGYVPAGRILREASEINPSDFPELIDCLKAGMLCNDSLLLENEGRWTIQGDPTEGALLVSAAKAGLEMPTVLKQTPRMDAIPFESEHQFMATLHAAGPDTPGIVYLKGSAEAVMERCFSSSNTADRPDGLRPEQVHESVADMAAKGMRVLAFAKGEIKPGITVLDRSDVAGGMTFLGLQGMMDPPRQEAIRAVQICHSAGIRVKMITGDHEVTAATIARQIGIHNPSEVVSGKILMEIPDTELIGLADRANVFARVTPEQKLRLVQAIQAKGNVVAMTGDGVNDAPALKGPTSAWPWALPEPMWPRRPPIWC